MNHSDIDTTPDSQNADAYLRRVVWSTLRYRWYWLCCVAICSGVAAYSFAMQWRTESYALSTTLLHTGLPAGMSGVYTPLGVASCSELIRSTPVMSKLRDTEGLGIPPNILARLITVKTHYGSDLMSIGLQWGDLDDGIRMLDSLVRIFSEETVVHRNQILESQIVQMEQLVLEARANMDRARQLYENEESRQQLQHGDGLKANERRGRMQQQIELTQRQQFEQDITQKGIVKQKEILNSQLLAQTNARQEIVHDLRDGLITRLSALLKEARSEFAEQSSKRVILDQLIEELSSMGKRSIKLEEFEKWKVEVRFLVQKCTDALSPSAQQRAEHELSNSLAADAYRLEQSFLASKETRSNINELQMKLVTVENTAEMLQQRLVQEKDQLAKLDSEASFGDTTLLARADAQYEEAKRQYERLADQVNSMRQLKQSGLQEWKVAVPCAADSAEVSTTTKKLFALSFVCCFALGCIPVLGVECLRQMETPQQAFARKTGLPVIGNLALRSATTALSTEEEESMRMLSLKIQQSIRRAGSLVVFSSLAEEGIAAPVLTRVARCLADRGEKVLLIDAVCPQRTTKRVRDYIVPISVPASNDEVGELQPATLTAKEVGLAEHLSEGDRLQTSLDYCTASPNIDVIDSGSIPFPHEALASVRLTQLLDQSKEQYSIVLLHGPGASSPVDMQMLAARADVIALVASKRLHQNRLVRETVADLQHLNAPILGVVSV